MKSLSVFLTCFLVLTFNLVSAQAENMFIVSGNPKAPPVVWEQYNTLTGIGPDLANAILPELGVHYQIKAMGNWQQVQDKCKNGEIDMIVSAYKNDERASYMTYSLPYLPQPTVIVVAKGNEFPFSRWEALIGKKGVTNIGESYGQEFDDFIKEKLNVQYIVFERAIELLSRGEADYLIVDLFTALIYSRLLQDENAITILEPPVTTQTFHMTIAKNSALAKRMPEINKKLRTLVKDGTVEQLFYKHFKAWKKLIAKRSDFFNKNSIIRSKEHENYLKEQDAYEKQRLGGLLLQSREGLPDAAK